jgi:hypothetical protein
LEKFFEFSWEIYSAAGQPEAAVDGVVQWRLVLKELVPLFNDGSAVSFVEPRCGCWMSWWYSYSAKMRLNSRLRFAPLLVCGSLFSAESISDDHAFALLLFFIESL